MTRSTLALFGGPAVRSSGEPTWPPRDPAVTRVLHELAETGAWGQYEGPLCETLEDRLAARHRWDNHDVHVRLTASGTAAVEFALRGVGVSDGDEVILAAWDFKANFANVTALGAIPVLVDVLPDTRQLNISQVADAITDQTKAVIASHLHGQLVDMPALRALADERGVAIVEDVCQTPLADVWGRPAGLWGDVGTLSFGGSKTLSAGRGGAVVTCDPLIAGRLERHDWRGNRLSPLSEMQAAVLLPQLDTFATRYEQRRSAAAWFKDAFDDVAGLTPWPCSTGQPDYYKVPFQYDAAALGGLSRERFCEAAHAEGVTLSPSFPSLHTTHARRRFRTVGDLSHATAAGEETVVLHHPVLLEDEAAWRQVVEVVHKIRDHADELRSCPTPHT